MSNPNTQEAIAATAAGFAAKAGESQRKSECREAIENANAHLNNVGMPNYTEMREELERADRIIAVLWAHVSCQHRAELDLFNRGILKIDETRGAVIRRSRGEE